MPNARDLRLQSDFEHLQALANGSGGALKVHESRGTPPDQYILIYTCRSIERLDLSHNRPIYRDHHRVEIKLPARYPAPYAAPKVKMLTPIWHPHVYKNLVVCMGDWKTSEYLDVFALRLGALLQYEPEFFDVRDPANEEAIDWARKNLLLFPTDTCDFKGGVRQHETVPPGFTPLMKLPELEALEHRVASRLREHAADDTILWEDIA